MHRWIVRGLAAVVVVLAFSRAVDAAGVCGVGIRDATAATYAAAQRVDRLSVRIDRLVGLLDELLAAFRRQGWLEVEFRRSDRPLFSVRVYLPPPDREAEP